jgi:hypothetical protein
MEKLEKFILSVKYLPTILYFGSIGLLIYNFEVEFLNDFTETLLYFIFCYLTYLGAKDYKKKEKINHSL